VVKAKDDESFLIVVWSGQTKSQNGIMLHREFFNARLPTTTGIHWRLRHGCLLPKRSMLYRRLRHRVFNVQESLAINRITW